MKRGALVVLLLIMLALFTPGVATAVSVSPGEIGDALIFPLIEVTNLDTLLAIENNTGIGTNVVKVRFRGAAAGTDLLTFTLCLPPNSTWTATVARVGSVTKVTSTSTFLVNGSATPLDAAFSPDSTRAFMEVIGLRNDANPAVCSDPSLGGDVSNGALTGRVYYVKGGTPPLVYGASALALKDFSASKIGDGTVFGSDAVAQALIAESGPEVPFSQRFITRYFVPASFGAVTQVVLAFPTGPTSGGCPSCFVPSGIAIRPRTDSGATLTDILVSDSSLVRVISLSSSDIANPEGAGLLHIVQSTGETPLMPAIGFAINTTTPDAGLFFNVLFPL